GTIRAGIREANQVCTHNRVNDATEPTCIPDIDPGQAYREKAIKCGRNNKPGSYQPAKLLRAKNMLHYMPEKYKEPHVKDQVKPAIVEKAACDDPIPSHRRTIVKLARANSRRGQK